MKAEEFRERKDEMYGWPISIASHRLGDTFFCTIYNANDLGGVLCRGKGATRDEAESSALEKARVYVERSGYGTKSTRFKGFF